MDFCVNKWFPILCINWVLLYAQYPNTNVACCVLCDYSCDNMGVLGEKSLRYRKMPSNFLIFHSNSEVKFPYYDQKGVSY